MGTETYDVYDEPLLQEVDNVTHGISWCNISNATTPLTRTDLVFFEFIVYGILLCGIGVLGLIGNCITIFILSRPQMRSSLNVILIGLSSFDSIVVVLSIETLGVPAILEYTMASRKNYNYIHAVTTPYIFPLMLIAQTSSVYFTVIVTVERYIAVCHPLRARSWCTYGRARIVVAIISLFSLLYNAPRFLEVDTDICYDSYNETSYRLKPSSLRDDVYVNVYVGWLYLFVMYIIPFTLLALLNIAIYQQVRKANRERSILTNSQRREIGLATMLLCVVVVFFICNILPLVNNILEAFLNIFIDELVRLSNLLVIINSSVNFVIYCIFGDKFKRLFLRYFCRRRVARAMSGRSSPENSISAAYAQRTSTVCTRFGAVSVTASGNSISRPKKVALVNESAIKSQISDAKGFTNGQSSAIQRPASLAPNGYRRTAPINLQQVPLNGSRQMRLQSDPIDPPSANHETRFTHRPKEIDSKS